MEYIEKGRLTVYKSQIEDMKQYEIIDRLMPIFKNWLDKIQSHISKKGIIFHNAKDQYNRILYDGCIAEEMA